MIIVPGLEEAAADEIVDPLLVGAEQALAGRGRGGDDRVVIGDAGVVDEAPAEGLDAAPRRDKARVAAGDGLDHGAERGGGVLREVAAVGARVAEELVPLVEGLRDIERLLRAHPEEAVGVALELGQIVEERRRSLRVSASTERIAALPERALATIAAASSPSGEPLALGRIVLVLVAGRGRAKPGAFVGDVGGLSVFPDRREGGQHLEVVLGHEVADGDLAIGDDGQRRCLDAADRDVLIERQAVRAGEVHPHEPVGPAPPLGGVGEAVVVGAALEAPEAVADRVGRERRDPESAHRLGALRGLVDVTEDELPFAPRVRGADDALDRPILHDPANDGELSLGVGDDDERKAVRQHRERPEAPALPAGVDLVRLRQRDEVPDGPRDDVPAPFERPVTPPRRAEDGGDITGDCGLLGDYGDGHGGGEGSWKGW